MDVLKTYLDSMFNKIEVNEETLRLKAEILANMEDKYQDLIDSDLSEHEAVGKVITEFGSFEELIDAYQLKTQDKNNLPHYPLLTKEEINTFITNNTKSNLLTALGTFLMIASSSIFLTFQSILGENSTITDILGISSIILSIIIAIGLYITARQFKGKPKNLTKGDYRLSGMLEIQLKSDLKNQEKVATYGFIAGTALILLPIIPIGILDSLNVAEGIADLTLSGFLVCVASAVFLFIYLGGNRSTYKKLLESGLSSQPSSQEIYQKERLKKADKIFDDIYWPLVTVIYFVWSFMSGAWAISWLIFIIASVIENLLKHLLGLTAD
ncbi:permease prefix domain 1-containing protein [Facklamia sp. 7083-14-GEN3]|uniref:permease prefix domain 1-containing protein n=1 Tax=Facklamia sp. 7083-14-GEN3 TaxID=2973478 RepID=UPI00215D1BCD|nr:permease prefix domain 1-containing protein [Facklamia sp. 7083-14-GEN3]MCR8969635.1 permease prefix domain 1-containing protein [Facklamia sp. 7083-14-GEN3]